MRIKVFSRSSTTAKALWLTISKVITLLISLITSMLLSRFRTLEEYGTYSELIMIITLAVSVSSLGLPNSINYFIPRCQDDGEKNKFISVYYTCVSILGGLTGAILIIAVPLWVFYFKNPEIILYSYVLAIIPWTKVIIGSRANMFIANNLIRKEIYYNITNSIALLLIIVLTKFLNQTFSFYLVLYVFVEVLFSLVVYIEIKKITPYFKFQIDKKLLKTILFFSIPLGISTALGTLCTEVDKLMIGWFFDTETVAIYSNAGRELPIVYLSSSFTAVTMPKIVEYIKKDRYDKAISIWKKSAELCFVFMSFFSYACIVFAPQIISVLYSDKYLTGVPIFRVYCVALLCRITYWGMILNAIGRTKSILYNSLLSLGTNVVLNFVFLFIWGRIGPALATVCSLIITAYYQLRLTSKSIGMKIKDCFSFVNIIRVLVLNVIFSCVFYVASNMLNLQTSNNDIILTILMIIIWGLMYLLILKKYILRLIRMIDC